MIRLGSIIRPVLRFKYRWLLKPLLFHLDPERVHDRVTALGARIGRTPWQQKIIRACIAYQHPALRQTVAGIEFANPFGLAGGFDKEGYLPNAMAALGFGFSEVGSITAQPCAGNPKPRLWRLPKSQGIIVNYGLKSSGSQAMAQRLAAALPFPLPVGINIGKTNSAVTAEDSVGIADYVACYRDVAHLGSYVTLNISCPNAFGGLPFTDATRLEELLAALQEVRNMSQPFFVKLPPDLDEAQITELVAVGSRYQVTGYVCTNLTKQWQPPAGEWPQGAVGGVSGKPVAAASLATIRSVYRATGGRAIIIGCGGIFSAADAYERIKAGASLVQLITGLLFQGPQLVADMNHGLVKLLARDGYKNVAQAVGAGYRS